ncbi:hypothetical protein [Bdellovibrio sp. BCCA]|uniref:hypothetical protein n=1 Tax=Bdellovibrio sp. BCCA TaxID=3136281 RepID=UPI0030F247C2
MKALMRFILGMSFLAAVTYEKPTTVSPARMISVAHSEPMSLELHKKRGHLLQKR